jgi:phage N-6-adenine-methyltransferase
MDGDNRMSVSVLLTELGAAGVCLIPDGPNLRIRGKPVALASFADRIREHKPALLALLAAPAEGEEPNGDDWYTPEDWVAPARALMGAIDLDPASCAAANAVVRAARYYTKQDDGLVLPWVGRVWLNPPYSRVADFAAKLETEFDAGRVTQAIMLCNARPDPEWFRRLAVRFPLLCTKGRVRFWRPASAGAGPGPRIGQALFGLGIDPPAFARAYTGMAYAPNAGVCWHPDDVSTADIQDRIVAAATVDPAEFDRGEYDRLWALWSAQENAR